MKSTPKPIRANTPEFWEARRARSPYWPIFKVPGRTLQVSVKDFPNVKSNRHLQTNLAIYARRWGYEITVHASEDTPGFVTVTTRPARPGYRPEKAKKEQS